MSPSPAPPRTQVRRAARKQVHDRAALDQLLSLALVGHVAVVDDDQPYVLPVAIAPDGDRLLLHGSTGSRLFRALAQGAPTCLTVTALDGLVLARSQFNSSMHYRSAVVIGRCTVLDDAAQKAAALITLTEHLMPGRTADARAASTKELAATLMLALPLDEWSLKVSNSPPDDEPADVALPVWAGTVALQHTWGSVTPAPDLVGDHTVPSYVAHWPAGRT